MTQKLIGHLVSLETGEVTQYEFDAPIAPDVTPTLSRADFVVALTQTTPAILTDEEALAALESFPPKFATALAGKPLPYRAAAIEAWRTTTTVARDAPLFLDLLGFYAAAMNLTEAQAQALGDAIFAGASFVGASFAGASHG